MIRKLKAKFQYNSLTLIRDYNFQAGNGIFVTLSPKITLHTLSIQQKIKWTNLIHLSINIIRFVPLKIVFKKMNVYVILILNSTQNETLDIFMLMLKIA